MLLQPLQRLGLLLPPFERSLWVVVRRASSLEAALPLLDRWAQQCPGYPLVVSAAGADAQPALRRLEGSEYLVPLPRLGPAGLGALSRSLAALRPAAVVLLDPHPALRRRLLQRGLPTLDAGDLKTLGERLLAVVPPVADPRARLAFRRDHWGLRVGQTGLARAATRLLGHRCLPDWPALAARLGRPQAILCLGNGPSSADPPPALARDACLFRVNWIWRTWDGASRPALVVVGNSRLPRQGPKPVLVFHRRAEATYTLLRQLLRGNPRRFDYLVLADQRSPLTEIDWPARPSGGVIMLAVATALAPARLAIAGIDLYRHAAGRYPGDGARRNAYARAHDRDTEVAMIARLLEDFGGQLEIHGAPLREALQARSKVA